MAGKIFKKLTGKKVPGTVREVDKIVEKKAGHELPLRDSSMPVVSVNPDRAIEKALRPSFGERLFNFLGKIIQGEKANG